MEISPSGSRGGSPARDAILLAFAAAAFLHLVIFRGGTFVYLFHKASGRAPVA